ARVVSSDQPIPDFSIPLVIAVWWHIGPHVLVRGTQNVAKLVGGNDLDAVFQLRARRDSIGAIKSRRNVTTILAFFREILESLVEDDSVLHAVQVTSKGKRFRSRILFGYVHSFAVGCTLAPASEPDRNFLFPGQLHSLADPSLCVSIFQFF